MEEAGVDAFCRDSMPVGQGAVAHMKTINDAIGNVVGLQRLIDTGEFDAVIAVSPENVRYIADVEISTQRLIRDRLALIVWAKGQQPVMVLCQVEEGYARQESWIGDIRSFKEFVTPPMRLVADVLREKGLAGARVGCENIWPANISVSSRPICRNCASSRARPCFAAPA